MREVGSTVAIVCPSCGAATRLPASGGSQSFACAGCGQARSVTLPSWLSITPPSAPFSEHYEPTSA